MDLFCPHCTRRVTVPDDKAGQVLSCPLCAKQFMAPSLAPPPAAPKPPAPSPPPAPAPKLEESYGLGPAPVPPPTPVLPKPAPVSVAAHPEPPAPPPPTGDYSRSCACCLHPSWLALVTPFCVVLIFVLSFFTWHTTGPTTAVNLWGLAFTQTSGIYIPYTILLILALPLAFVAMVFDKGWIVAPPQLAPAMLLKNLVVALFLGIALLLMCFDYIDGNLFVSQTGNPIAWPLKLAFRLNFVAVLASLLMFWLHWRAKYNLPLPRFEMRW